ncbi:PhzF family phenazine biosynthesis protein [Aquimarina sp. W85]|uniref:PhzF family phenazine biosynthesis protein n=1 Tax=Aquimarina rhodophyticola TaxID=3342246 RepID=UPI0036720749
MANGAGGNPAGVVLNADNLSNQQKLQIANKVGLSETAFVSKSNSAGFKLDFFTPNKQIAHCGHATVAKFSYLKQIGAVSGERSSKETIDGNRDIALSGKLVFMEQLAPTYIDVGDKESEILTSLGLQKTDLSAKAPIKVVNTGNPFMLIPVKDTEILKNLSPDFDLINKISEAFDLIGYYVFTTNTENAQLNATSRMFGPRYGIQEEAGTGMAAGPLACYLHDVLSVKKQRYHLQQGKYMHEPSSSLILVDLLIEQEKIKGLMAGGKGLLKSEMNVEIDL